MENKRRDFLKNIGLTGLGLAGSCISPVSASSGINSIIDASSLKSDKPLFNMSGYKAPALEKIRVGVVGLGNRGMGALERLLKIDGIQIMALCDLRESRTSMGLKKAQALGHKPQAYHGSQEIWKKLCERTDIDLVYILTPWQLHTPQAVFSMEHGKHAFVEVPAATTVDECWQLVNTSEKTKKHCVMVENCCYDFHELLTLNMAQQGFFGEIIHGEGAYIHGLADLLFNKDRFYQMWELKESMGKTGNLYPTHGLGPICQIMNINRGDRLEYLVSVSSDDFVMGNLANKLAAKDDFYKPFVKGHYNGNMSTSTIKTSKGRTIVVQYDVTSPRPYSRAHVISGTKATAQKFPLPARISTGEDWMSPKELKELEQQYMPPIVKKIGDIAKEIGGHGGMDFLMDWRNIDCLRNGLAMDQDVYDAAAWSVVTPLSVWSVANRSNSIDVPDFTRGNWAKNKPIDLSMQTGGTTKVLKS